MTSMNDHDRRGARALDGGRLASFPCPFRSMRILAPQSRAESVSFSVVVMRPAAAAAPSPHVPPLLFPDDSSRAIPPTVRTAA